MTQAVVSVLFHIAAVLPLIALAVRRDSRWVRAIGFFAAFVIMNRVLLTLPVHFPQFSFIDGQKNWSGKIYATVGCLAVVLLFRKKHEHRFFVRFQQNEGSLKWTIPVALLILLLGDGIPALFMSSREWSAESLAYQLTMPGIQEELAFRGVMLGLLATVCCEQLRIRKLTLGSPASLVTAVLFGLAHSFSISTGWDIRFSVADFYVPFVWGWLWAWMTLKSGSILVPLLTHNASNSLLACYLMLK